MDLEMDLESAQRGFEASPQLVKPAHFPIGWCAERVSGPPPLGGFLPNTGRETFTLDSILYLLACCIAEHRCLSSRLANTGYVDLSGKHLSCSPFIVPKRYKPHSGM